MGRDRRKTEFPIALRRQQPAVLIALEPQDRGAQDAAFEQILPSVRRHDAEVLADHHGPGPMRLQHQDPDQRLVVVVDVGAGVGTGTRRHPPQPEQPQHMIDTNPAGVPEYAAHQVAERRVAEFGETLRMPRRLGPVLPELVVLIRWRAD